MVHFGHYLVEHAVPEWSEKYLNYKRLKKILKPLNENRVNNPDHIPKPSRTQSFWELKQGASTENVGAVPEGLPKALSSMFNQEEEPGEKIAVNDTVEGVAMRGMRMRPLPTEHEAKEHGKVVEDWRTMIPENLPLPEVEADFAVATKDELNKIDEFYRKQELYFFEKVNTLGQQLRELQHLRRGIRDAGVGATGADVGGDYQPLLHPQGEESSSSARSSVAAHHWKAHLLNHHGRATQSHHEQEPNGEDTQHKEKINNTNANSTNNNDNHYKASSHNRNSNNNHKTDSNHKTNSKQRPHPLPRLLPAHPFGVLNLIERKTKQQQVLEIACKELYRGLDLLKNYRILNYTGFHKVLKKHDKVSDFNATSHYLPQIRLARVFWSDTPRKIEKKLEEIYNATFNPDGGKKKHELVDELRGDYSKPLSMWVVCGLGLCLGISLCLIVTFIVIIEVTPNFSSKKYFTASFPVFRGVGLLLFQVWLWGANVYFYHLTRINHVFILKIKHRTFLRYQDVWQGAGILTVIYMSCLCLYFLAWTLPVGPHGKWLKQPGWVVMALFTLTLCLIFCPFNVLMRQTRLYLLGALFRIIIAPFAKVKFIDFFLADQLTSAVRIFPDLQYAVCYITTTAFLSNNVTRCTASTETGRWVVSFLPAYWRFCQCLRRWRDSGYKQADPHLINAMKYFSACIVTLFSLLTGAYPKNKTFLILWIISAVISTSYSYAWDILKDWSLVEKWQLGGLRKKRVVRQKWVYYLAAVINLILRVSWILTISPTQFGLEKTQQFNGMALGAAELIRRAIWNFFRMENEHLNNCGQYRAVEIVPLPTQFVGKAAILPDSKLDKKGQEKPDKGEKAAEAPRKSSAPKEEEERPLRMGEEQALHHVTLLDKDSDKDDDGDDDDDEKNTALNKIRDKIKKATRKDSVEPDSHPEPNPVEVAPLTREEVGIDQSHSGKHQSSPPKSSSPPQYPLSPGRDTFDRQNQPTSEPTSPPTSQPTSQPASPPPPTSTSEPNDGKKHVTFDVASPQQYPAKTSNADRSSGSGRGSGSESGSGSGSGIEGPVITTTSPLTSSAPATTTTTKSSPTFGARGSRGAAVELSQLPTSTHGSAMPDLARLRTISLHRGLRKRSQSGGDNDDDDDDEGLDVLSGDGVRSFHHRTSSASAPRIHIDHSNIEGAHLPPSIITTNPIVTANANPAPVSVVSDPEVSPLPIALISSTPGYTLAKPGPVGAIVSPLAESALGSNHPVHSPLSQASMISGGEFSPPLVSRDPHELHATSSQLPSPVAAKDRDVVIHMPTSKHGQDKDQNQENDK